MLSAFLLAHIMYLSHGTEEEQACTLILQLHFVMPVEIGGIEMQREKSNDLAEV